MLVFEDKESELKFNELAREQFILKLLSELEVDLMVCQLSTQEPMKYWGDYVERIKNEIDRLYERIKISKNE